MAETDRRPCYFTLPNGVPFLDQSTFDRLHHHAGALAHLASTTDGIGGTKRLDDHEVADLLDSARYTARLANEALQLAVDTARGHGWTWEQIGDSFGITKQAAGKRFGPVVRTARPRCPQDPQHYLDSHAPGGAWYGVGHNGQPSPYVSTKPSEETA